MDIKITKLDKKRILDYGFESCGDSWYKKLIPTTGGKDYGVRYATRIHTPINQPYAKSCLEFVTFAK